MTNRSTSDAQGRFERLLLLLHLDPENLPLLADTAEAALAAARPDTARELLERYCALAPLPPRETNLAGVAALQLKRFDEAAEWFESLIAAGEEDGAVAFNLAWSRAMQRQFDDALPLRTQEVTHALPQAATLHVQILHEKGEFDEAGKVARGYADRFPNYRPLMAAISVLALDLDDEELAGRCAALAPDHPDSLATIGMLTLRGERPEEALALFDRALDGDPGVPRAWIGRGLAQLLSGSGESAASDIDRGAEMFGTHLGSWIAAGWAYYAAGDYAASRVRFERALTLDATFAEAHGSLAVLDLLGGDVEQALARSEVALRLDRRCYSAALARTLIAAGAGDAAKARRIYEAAINMPVDESGRTVAQALARLGGGLG